MLVKLVIFFMCIHTYIYIWGNHLQNFPRPIHDDPLLTPLRYLLSREPNGALYGGGG